MVVLIDPSDDPDDILRINRSREKQYVFDVTFDGNTTQVSLIVTYTLLQLYGCHNYPGTFALHQSVRISVASL